MAKKKAPSPFAIWRNNAAASLPQPVKDRWNALQPQQRSIIVVIACSLSTFLVVWLFIASFQEKPARIVSDKQLQIPSDERGINTAITKPVKNFPEQSTGQTPFPSNIKSFHLTPLQQNQLLELKQNVDNIYKSVLSFTLDEAKMIVFAQAATKIDMVNAKWDMLIAGAADDKLANEYLNSATLESKSILDQTLGITQSQYNEIYTLSARDANFNKIANAYKKLVAEGIWGPVTPAITNKSTEVNINSEYRFPVSPKSITPPATPAADGIAPAPADLPELPYSSQQSH